MLKTLPSKVALCFEPLEFNMCCYPFFLGLFKKIAETLCYPYIPMSMIGHKDMMVKTFAVHTDMMRKSVRLETVSDSTSFISISCISSSRTAL